MEEIEQKWHSIDDEIWAKIICLERNRRIAKAYARKRQLTINGSLDDYVDGTCLGLNSFENPDRDAKTNNIRQYIGQGVRLTINQNGDILARRLSKANVFVHQLQSGCCNQSDAASAADCSNPSCNNNSNYDDDGYEREGHPPALYGMFTAQRDNGAGGKGSGGSSYPLSSAGLRSRRTGPPITVVANSSSGASSASSSTKHGNGQNQPQRQLAQTQLHNQMTRESHLLARDQLTKVFHMDKFKEALERECRQSRPNRALLQSMCVSVISFVLDDTKMLNLPVWIMIVNIVAVDLLRAHLGAGYVHDQNHHYDDNYTVYYSTRNDSSFYASGQAAEDEQQQQAVADDNFVSPYDGGKPAVVASITEGNDERRRQWNHLLSASKRAFANAAAGNARIRGYHKMSATSDSALNHLRNEERQICGKDDYDDEDEHKSQCPNHQMAPPRQPLSSSSGFNSHCSLSQNNSSTASSDSNIAAGLNSDESSVFATTCLQQHHQQQTVVSGSNGCVGASPERSHGGQPTTRPLPRPLSSDGPLAGIANQRGKRPPKLPHGVSAAPDIGKTPLASQPIAIPAPPTSAGGQPSGKANLILLSPTGLSPPLPKRKIALNAAAGKAHCHSKEPQVTGQELESIYKIPVGSGQTAVPSMGPPSKGHQHELPAGIPAHAQLAPPATRRHILRYLRSASGNLQVSAAAAAVGVVSGGQRSLAATATTAEINSKQHLLRNKFLNRNDQNPQPAGPSFSLLQRPLPVVPPKQRSSEESLYYCGMQARVPNWRAQPQLQLGTTQQQAKKVIGALLNANLQQQQQKQHHLLMQQQLARNLHGWMARSGQKVVSDNSQQLLRAAQEAAAKSIPDVNRSKIFASLDNLAQPVSIGTSQKGYSLLNQFGGLLKRSKKLKKFAPAS